MRSRSFRRLNRAFSVLRRTKSGTAVASETTEERDNLRNTNIPPEGECGSCKYCIWTPEEDQIKPIKINKASCFIRGPVLALTLECIVVIMFIIVNYVV